MKTSKEEGITLDSENLSHYLQLAKDNMREMDRKERERERVFVCKCGKATHVHEAKPVTAKDTCIFRQWYQIFDGEYMCFDCYKKGRPHLLSTATEGKPLP